MCWLWAFRRYMYCNLKVGGVGALVVGSLDRLAFLVGTRSRLFCGRGYGVKEDLSSNKMTMDLNDQLLRIFPFEEYISFFKYFCQK